VNAFAKLFDDFFNARSRELLTGCIGTIERHDIATMRADVKPLLKYLADGTTQVKDYQIIPNIPVLFLYAGGYYIRPEYKRGDLVWVTFATHEIERPLAGVPGNTDGRLFSRENAAVVYGIARTGWSVPGDFSKPGLLIGHEGGGMYAHLQQGKISIKGDLEVDGKVSATGAMDSDGEITAMKQSAPVKLSTHIHPTGVGPSGSPNPGS